MNESLQKLKDTYEEKLVDFEELLKESNDKI